MITTTAMRSIILFILFAGILASPHPAASEDGNQLYNWLLAYKRVTQTSDLKPLSDFTDSGKGMGFVNGVISALNGRDFCLPPGVTQAQGIDIVLQYLETHPEERHMNAAFLVVSAIRPKFPCSK